MSAQQIQLLILLLLIPGFSTAQPDGNPVSAEKVVSFTDRDLYITGEKVLFSAVVTDDGTGGSNILYAEIITPDGKSMASGKFSVSGGRAGGCLAIPEEVSTGFYFFRAYTRLMRNVGPSAYDYHVLRIINPNKKDVLVARLQDNLNEPRGTSTGPPPLNDTCFDLELDKNLLNRGDTVRIRVTGKNAGDLKGICLSAVPASTVDKDISCSISAGGPAVHTNFFPESRGLTLTGRVSDQVTGKSLPVSGVSLSIIGEGRDFMATETDSSGSFFFSLPAYTGDRDLFLGAESRTGTDPRIQVDNDFCPERFSAALPVFSLEGEERQAALIMARNRQVQKYFYPDSIRPGIEVIKPDRPFYGTPDHVLSFENYVQLPALEEYFNELPGLVKVRKRQGQKYFKVYGKQSGLNSYDPLVLVDMVAVDDPERVLGITPQQVSRIEIVNELYVKGGRTYGGIVSIFSKRGDFAGIDLPASGLFLNYRFIEENAACTLPLPTAGLPDTRNTLYWNPAIKIVGNETYTLVFTTSETPGKYLVVLSGVDGSGKAVRQTLGFEVK